VRIDGIITLSSQLRFSVEEYEAILRVSDLVILRGLLSEFQRSLVPPLRQTGWAPLADRIAGMPADQLHVLRYHLDRLRREARDEAPSQALSVSFDEWRAIDRVCRLVLLRADDIPSFREGLLNGLADEAPALAEKLSTLDEAGIAGLHRRAVSGRRWCP
jgi:hypothetical protein